MSIKSGKYTNLSASAQVKAGEGILRGMYVNSTNAGTVKLWDSLTAANTVINNTITPAIGYHDLGGVAFSTGLYFTKGGTAIDVTFHWE